MRRLVWLGVAVLVVAVAAGSAPALRDGLHLGTALSAKLGCSARYLSNFEADRVASDLASYSPLLHLVSIDYDDVERRSAAALLGLGRRSASYREGLGCTLDLAGGANLDALSSPEWLRIGQPWPLGSRMSAPMDDKLQVFLQQWLDDDNAAGLQTRALLVVQDGQLRGEHYGAGIDAQTPLLAWSVGKTLMAVWAARLEDRGSLDPQSAGLFPEWRRDARKAITVEHLLQMRSGLAFDETYLPGHDATRMLFQAPGAAAMAQAKLLAYPAGEHFSYSSGTSNILASVLQDAVGGRSQAAINSLHATVLRPLGMTRTTVELDPGGTFVGSSFAYGSGRDWARLGLLLQQDGHFAGSRLLPEGWVERATTPNPSLNEPRYGYQLWLNRGGAQLRWPQLPADAYAMLGNRGQVVMIVPSASLVLVRLGWSAAEYPTDARVAALLRQLDIS